MDSVASVLGSVHPLISPFLNSGIAGCLATTVVQPVDMVKIRLQLAGEGTAVHGARPSAIGMARSIVAADGFGSLYKGISAGYARQVVYGSSRMGLYRVFADSLQERRSGGAIPVWEKVGAGVAAGGIASFLGNPADLALVRMQTDSTFPPAARRNYNGIVDTLTRIVREEGVLALWRGSSPTVLRALVLNATMMPVSDSIKESIGPSLGGPASTTTKVLASSLAGVASAVTSLPFDMIKTRLQKQKPGPDGVYPYRGLIHCGVTIARTEGVPAFFKGLSAYVVRIAPHITIALLILDSLNEAVAKERRARAATA